MKVKGETEKAGSNLSIQKMKVMAPSPITSWQIDGETMEIVTGFIFLGSKIKSVTVSIVFPSICHKVIGPDAMILVF